LEPFGDAPSGGAGIPAMGAAEAAGIGCAGGIGGNGAAHVVAGKGAEALEVAPAPTICGDSSTTISELLVGKVSWLLGEHGDAMMG